MRASGRYLIIKSNSKFTGTNLKSSWKLISGLFEINAHFMAKILLRTLLHEHHKFFYSFLVSIRIHFLEFLFFIKIQKKNWIAKTKTMLVN